MEKGDNEPHNPMSAYASFVKACFREHKERHSEKPLVREEFACSCAEKWQVMSDEEKSRFRQTTEKENSALIWFANDERRKIQESMPHATVENIAMEIEKRWNDAPPHVRAKYEDLAVKDKARYIGEMKAYMSESKTDQGSPYRSKTKDSGDEADTKEEEIESEDEEPEKDDKVEKEEEKYIDKKDDVDELSEFLRSIALQEVNESGIAMLP